MTVVVGMDTATADTVVGITRDGEPAWERSVRPPETGHPRHIEALLAEVEEAVAACGGWEGVDLIAVGVGPGSFTGTRIAVSTARALAQALELPLAGVGTLAALAGGIGEHPDASDRSRLGVLDARRAQVFAALYDPGGEETWAPLVSTPDELAARAGALEAPPLAAGDGAIRFRSELEAAGIWVLPDSERAHRLQAHQVCRLAEREPPEPPEAIRPIYLRPPDAKLWRQRDRGAAGGGPGSLTG